MRFKVLAFLVMYLLLLPWLVGTAQDVSLIADFLPSYLYPSNERTIGQWSVAGFSLGGHSTWIALKNGQYNRLLHLPWLTSLQISGWKLVYPLSVRPSISRSFTPLAE